MSKEIYFDKLTYYYKSPYLSPMNFISFKSPMHIYSDTETGNISIEKIEVDQKQFKSKLNKITIGNLNLKSKDQLDAIKNIKNLYKSRDKVNKLYNDYAKIISDDMYKAKQRTGLKMLTLKQMLQRLPEALTQAKAGNSSESLLNQIRKIVCSLYK